jgi:serine/threonine protein kinase
MWIPVRQPDTLLIISGRRPINTLFTEKEALRMIANLALGIFEIHSQGIQHRDLKPGKLSSTLIVGT